LHDQSRQFRATVFFRRRSFRFGTGWYLGKLIEGVDQRIKHFLQRYLPRKRCHLAADMLGQRGIGQATGDD
jgi:hypothetical protein